MSDDILAEVNEAIFTKLQERHPHAAEIKRNVPVPLSIKACLLVSESEVKANISKFPADSAGSSDELRLQHVSDLLNYLEVGLALLTEIANIRAGGLRICRVSAVTSSAFLPSVY